MIIGICGRAGSGKSSVANYLVENYGARRISLADPLKQMAMAIYGLTERQVYGTQDDKETPLRWLPGIKGELTQAVTPRELLQRLGTDVCRKYLGPNVWADAMFARVGADLSELWICDDVRFANEAMKIHGSGGQIWRLHCADRVSADAGTHASETEVDLIPPGYITAELRGSRACGLEPLFVLVRDLMRGLK
jgi:hypothetical protein